nr:uncharacterized protein I203_05342 [Kwoniella mangroviensis CBS 8507]OCF65662.1 hypothetical protein I203_05342 [Kwoniella mangroviensis CBS 8507]
MGRKKIEIRPLTDERNRNVTFLKRKAGLMKKAWELSVLCGADVNILIFNAAGKAYEFSSKELDEEIDRYMDYEGMIERRRAPEFAAMALAGEDDEDEDEDEAPRRGSTSKSTANTTAGPNGAVPRSLKGKESFKARTPRHSDKGKSSSSRSSKHNKSKRRKERSESEKRSFIDSILSQSESDSQDDEDDEDEREIGGMRRKRKEKEKERSRDRRERQRTGGYDKNAAALQYAMSMHSAHPHGHGHGHGQGHSHGQHESRFYQQHRYHDEPGSNAQLPVDIPQLPKLPSDGTSYRTSMTSGLGNGSGTGGQSSSTFYGHSQPQYISQTHQYLPSSSLETTIPSQGQYSGNVSTSQGMANVSRPGGIQWNENLLAKYAEFQLQQNHQKQQRLLLERQRYQLQQMGVPVDERSLLDEIFGGNLSQAQAQAQGGSQAYGSTTAGGAGGGIILPIEDSNPTGTGGSADFVWPLGNNRSTTTNHPEDQFMPHDQSGNTSRGSIPIPDESVQWGVQDGYTVDRDDLNLPSPVSNGPGPGLGAEGKRKAMIFRDNEEVKRMRI